LFFLFWFLSNLSALFFYTAQALPKTVIWPGTRSISSASYSLQYRLSFIYQCANTSHNSAFAVNTLNRFHHSIPPSGIYNVKNRVLPSFFINCQILGLVLDEGWLYELLFSTSISPILIYSPTGSQSSRETHGNIWILSSRSAKDLVVLLVGFYCGLALVGSRLFAHISLRFYFIILFYLMLSRGLLYLRRVACCISLWLPGLP
jgi:hypothetical protein